MLSRCEIVFRGRVQGVGFRYTASRLARRTPGITGWVRNEPDGSVRMIVEGQREEIEALISDIREDMKSNISGISANWSSPATGEFDRFDILRS